MSTEPEAYYHECLAAIGATKYADWPNVAGAYAERAYHNLDHLREMLGHLQACAPHLAYFGRLSTSPATAPLFGIALIYHDVIYQAGRKDNEAKSAEAARFALHNAGAPASAGDYAERLIMATKHHVPSAQDEGDEALLIDLDLAVLARDAAGYDRYAAAVRQEFRKYPGFLYRPGRKKALRHFLDQEHIYCTDYFRERFEVRARENLLRELTA